jgi:hypothetical protein
MAYLAQQVQHASEEVDDVAFLGFGVREEFLEVASLRPARDDRGTTRCPAWLSAPSGGCLGACVRRSGRVKQQTPAGVIADFIA